MLIHSLKARSTWWWYEAYAGINCCSLTKYKISVIISKLQTMELSSPGFSTSMGSNIKKCRSEVVTLSVKKKKRKLAPEDGVGVDG